VGIFLVGEGSPW